MSLRPWFTLNLETNEYQVYGDTFRHREELKSIGGSWRPDRKLWRLPRTEASLGSLRRLGIQRTIKCHQDAFCHEPEADRYLDQNLAEQGFTDRNFCGLCDSWCSDTVVHVMVEDI